MAKTQGADPEVTRTTLQRRVSVEPHVDSSLRGSLVATVMSSASFKTLQPTGTDERTLRRSMWAVRFGLFADAMSTTVLWPNYAFLASPGTTKDSFEETGPFDFAAATYWMPMMSLLAAAITSCVMGSLSDRFGRRPSMLICVGMSVFWTIGKFLLRNNFWTFSVGLFVNGLFAGSLPVALTYASDVCESRRERDTQMSLMFALYTVGWRFGGVLTIFLSDFGLFTPLLAGAFINIVATVFLVFFMIEPKEMDLLVPGDLELGLEGEFEDIDITVPKSFNKKLFGTLCVSSVLDGIGTIGCFPLTMAPLAFDTFFARYMEAGEDPVMSPTAYRWSNVLVGFTALIGSALAKPVFRKVGIPAGCVASNVIVATGPMVCLFISHLNPTKLTLSAFMIVVYFLYPVTIMSQVAISLMFDRISPLEHRGFAQGLNTTLQNVYVAIAPFALGVLSDTKGIDTAIYTVAGIGFLGILIKIPLFFSDSLTKTNDETKSSSSDDEKAYITTDATESESTESSDGASRASLSPALE